MKWIFLLILSIKGFWILLYGLYIPWHLFLSCCTYSSFPLFFVFFSFETGWHSVRTSETIWWACWVCWCLPTGSQFWKTCKVTNHCLSCLVLICLLKSWSLFFTFCFPIWFWIYWSFDFAGVGGCGLGSCHILLTHL